MQVCIIVCSVLLCLIVAAKSCGEEGIKRVNEIMDITNQTAKCPCNETSVAPHEHYNQDSCTCFEIPEETSCNLSCFQAGVDKYKGIITTGNPGKFINLTFSKRAKLCAKLPCVQPCGNMITVNATIFWNAVLKAFQKMKSS